MNRFTFLGILSPTPHSSLFAISTRVTRNYRQIAGEWRRQHNAAGERQVARGETPVTSYPRAAGSVGITLAQHTRSSGIFSVLKPSIIAHTTCQDHEAGAQMPHGGAQGDGDGRSLDAGQRAVLHVGRQHRSPLGRLRGSSRKGARVCGLTLRFVQQSVEVWRLSGRSCVYAVMLCGAASRPFVDTG